jgi:hypothetical protein
LRWFPRQWKLSSRSYVTRWRTVGSVTWWYATPSGRYLYKLIVMLLLNGSKLWRQGNDVYIKGLGLVSTLLVCLLSRDDCLSNVQSYNFLTKIYIVL